jgi:hypothetical protein
VGKSHRGRARLIGRGAERSDRAAVGVLLLLLFLLLFLLSLPASFGDETLRAGEW